MTEHWRQTRKGRRPAAAVTTRADWRALILLAKQCVTDADDEVADGDARLRLMTLSKRAGSASSAVLDRDAGATVADTARAFLRLLIAFSRPATPSVTRCALAPTVGAAAAFLDDQLHQLNAEDFERAHRGRPEVYR